MKSVIVHGALLAVMLVYGYLTWTKEKARPSTTGEVVMWNRPASDLKAIEFATPERTLRLERRGDGAAAYWWGLETKTIKKAEGDDTTTREFPVGEPGDKLVNEIARMRAIKSIGVVDEAKRKDYELVDTSKTISVIFKDGAKTLVLGGRVHGGSDRYILDIDSNKGFVMTGTLVTPLEGGEGALRPADLRAFDPKEAMQVQIAVGDKTKTVKRIKIKKEPPAAAGPHAPPPKAQEIETWGEGTTADDTAANFIDKIEKLKPQSYDPKLDPKTLTSVVTLTYKDGAGKVLGTISVLKLEKPGEPPKVDPAAPPPATPPAPTPVVEYYLMTERTRVPAMLPKLAVDRVLPDFDTVFAAPAK